MSQPNKGVLLPAQKPENALYYPQVPRLAPLSRFAWPLFFAALCCLALALGLPALASKAPAATEHLYANGIFPAVSALWTYLAGFVPFSMAELLLYALAVAALVLVVWGVVFCVRRRWKQLAIGVLTLCLIASALFARFYIAWGLNYYRQPISVRMGLDVRDRPRQELADLCVSLATRAAKLRVSLPENADGSVSLGTADEFFDAVPAAFDALQSRFPYLNRIVAKPKPVLASVGMCYLGISGIYMPFTFECNVNAAQPSLLLPVIAAHEAVHQTGIAREDEANFIGYLACTASGDDRFEYSATMLALIHAGNALNGVSPQAYSYLYQTYYTEQMQRDLGAHNQFWSQYDGPVQEAADRSNDRYLKSNGQTEGVLSYGRMVDLLLAARAAGLIA